MLMENHMTLQLPLSGSILNPIDMAQVWKMLDRRWCRHLIPMHENSLPFYFFLFRLSQRPLGFLCSLRWTGEGGTVSAVIAVGIPTPHARCHVIRTLCRMSKLRLRCYNILIKVCCIHVQETEYPLVLERKLYIRLCKITVMELALPSIAFQWSSCSGGNGGDSASTTQTGFVKVALRTKMKRMEKQGKITFSFFYKHPVVDLYSNTMQVYCSEGRQHNLITLRDS